MKLYVCEWEDPAEGTRFSWHGGMTDAKRERARLRRERDVRPAVHALEWPKGKADLLSWLNKHVRHGSPFE